MPDYTAGIFIINQKNQILLTHATHSPRKFWGIPKGLVDRETGENEIEAAIREVQEETGIKILDSNKVHYLGDVKYKSGNKILIAYYLFLEDLPSNGLIIVGKENLYFMSCKPEKESHDDLDQNRGSIKTIDTNLLWCESMVSPRKDQEEPFPEVDAYRWVDINKAEALLYKPQKEILPNLIEIIRHRAAA